MYLIEKNIVALKVLIKNDEALRQGHSQEETTTEANTWSVVRNQPYEIFSYYQSDKKNKNRQYLVKFYRGECLGSPHTGYGGARYTFISTWEM